MILPLLILTGCSPGDPSAQQGSDRIMVATAANVQFAMEELLAVFEAESGISVAMTVSSSGKLTAQILQGAPYDIFLSANLKYPDTLIAQGLALPPNRTYARGALVLWTMRQDIDLGPSLMELTLPEHQKIAVANPRNAPYGAQSIRVLDNTGRRSVWEDQLIFGESISQTNQFIVSGAAAFGFTAKSVVRSPDMAGKGQWITIPDSLYQPIDQGVVLTKYGQENHPIAAKAFLDFLFSDTAQAIFRNYGYTPPSD